VSWVSTFFSTPPEHIELFLVRIAFSAFIGFLLGLERQIHRQPAGLKTHILICTGSTLVMLTSMLLSGSLTMLQDGLLPFSDPGRLAAQVISGIGFLGGGAILRQGFNIKGLTTAATIWVSAAIGLAIGLGAYFPAVITTLIALGTLVVMEWFESRFLPPKTIKTLILVYQENKIDYVRLEHELESLHILVGDIDINQTIGSNRIKIFLRVNIPAHVQIDTLIQSLQKVGSLLKIEITANERAP